MLKVSVIPGRNVSENTSCDTPLVRTEQFQMRTSFTLFLVMLQVWVSFCGALAKKVRLANTLLFTGLMGCVACESKLVLRMPDPVLCPQPARIVLMAKFSESWHAEQKSFLQELFGGPPAVGIDWRLLQHDDVGDSPSQEMLVPIFP